MSGGKQITAETPFVQTAHATIKLLKQYKKPSPKTGKIGTGIFARDFNDVVKEVYGKDFDVRAATDALLESGELEGHPVKGGFMFYLPGEGPQSQKPKASELVKHLSLELL